MATAVLPAAGTAAAATSPTAPPASASVTASAPASAQPAQGAPKPAPKPAPTPSAAKTSPAPKSSQAPRTAPRPAPADAAPCTGPLTFGTPFACAAVQAGQSQTYTVTTTVAADHLRILLSGDLAVIGKLTVPGSDPAADPLCGFSTMGGLADCAVPTAGSYDLTVQSQWYAGAYTVAVDSAVSGACNQLAAADFSTARAELTSTLAAGSTGDCYRFTQPKGSRLLLAARDITSNLQVRTSLVDAAGQPGCEGGATSGECVLTGTAPYTWRGYSGGATAGTYGFRLTRLSDPDGCASLAVAPFGDPGTAVTSGTLAPSEFTCRIVHAEPGLHDIRLRPDNGGNDLPWTVYAKDGTKVCATAYPAAPCSVPATGDYALFVHGAGWETQSFKLSVVNLSGTAGCAPAVGTGFAAPTLTGTVVSKLELDCQDIDAAPGERIITPSQGLFSIVTDRTGAAICTVDYSQDGCVLPGSGPYRLLSTRGSSWGDPSKYPFDWRMQILRLSHPADCPTLAAQPFGTAADTGTTRCRTVTAAAAGALLVTGFGPGDQGTPVSLPVGLYDADGKRVCSPYQTGCDVPAAGTYTMMLGTADRVVEGTTHAQFLTPTETRGCVATGDSGFAAGPVTGAIAALGQVNCLTLPTPSGAALEIYTTPGGDPLPAGQVLDATGAVQCSNPYAYAQTDCRLTGQAPFRLLLDRGAATGGYAVTIGRVDTSSGCDAFPQTSYQDTTGTAVALTKGHPVRCLAVPAGQHSVAEQFDYDIVPAPTGPLKTLPATIRVFGSDGKLACEGGYNLSTAVCRLDQAKAYTALLVGDGTDQGYRMVRRDLSASAPCGSPVSTTVGGTPVRGQLTSSLSAACTKVTAQPTDRFRFTSKYTDGAVLMVVTDADGKTLCTSGLYTAYCDVTGSTSYQAIMSVSDYKGTAIAYQLDTWRIGGADGVPPECRVIAADKNGFGPLTGTLTLDHPATCLTVPVKQQPYAGTIRISGAYAGTSTAVPRAQMINSAGTDYCVQYQSTDGYFTDCNPPGTPDKSDILLLSLRPGAAKTDYSVSVGCPTDRLCGLPDAEADPGTAFSPLTPSRLLDTRIGVGRPGTAPVPAGGTVALQVTGQGGVPKDGVRSVVLNVTVADPKAGGYLTAWPSGTARPTASSLNWTAGQVVPNLVTVPVGADGKVTLYNGSSGTSQFVADVLGYYGQLLPGSAFTPVGPQRVLDTRIGLGRPGNQPVGAGQSVVLKVAGAGGVPAAGASAVALNVTVTDTRGPGYLTAWPSGSARPVASNLNWVAGQTVPNMVVVPIGPDGTVSLYNGSPGTSQLVADVAGYYAGGSGGSLYRSAGPVRVMDTRLGQGAPAGAVPSHGTVVLDLNGTAGSAKPKAVVLNVTVTGPTDWGYLTAWPSGGSRPTASNLNWVKGQTIANQVVVPVGADGRVAFYNGGAGSVQVVIDRIGFIG
ncbi:hypothetical protein [Kitasatospora sp. McL0602]|uniref:hypothetical protein n=1 Tax=Kitasatospora sp. McL0602 TaxID=3439530 RepID=UPI003F88BB17